MHTFRDVETAAYCPRKLYYRQRSQDDFETPGTVSQVRDIAFEYEQLLADPERDPPTIAVTPTQFRTNLGRAKARLDAWDHLADPHARDVLLTGKDCRGMAHKRLETSPPSASLVFSGEPPENGVWRPQSVRLMAVAKALSWETEREVQRVYAEYPRYGVVREVPVDARRSATYREAVRIADAIDDPPARTDNRSRCEPCEFRADCGVRTRSLRSLLGV